MKKVYSLNPFSQVSVPDGIMEIDEKARILLVLIPFLRSVFQTLEQRSNKGRAQPRS